MAILNEEFVDGKGYRKKDPITGEEFFSFKRNAKYSPRTIEKLKKEYTNKFNSTPLSSMKTTGSIKVGHQYLPNNKAVLLDDKLIINKDGLQQTFNIKGKSKAGLDILVDRINNNGIEEQSSKELKLKYGLPDREYTKSYIDSHAFYGGKTLEENKPKSMHNGLQVLHDGVVYDFTIKGFANIDKAEEIFNKAKDKKKALKEISNIAFRSDLVDAKNTYKPSNYKGTKIDYKGKSIYYGQGLVSKGNLFYNKNGKLLKIDTGSKSPSTVLKEIKTVCNSLGPGISDYIVSKFRSEEVDYE